MHNKELLNICYSFFNKFITANDLIKKLENIDKTKLSKKDIKETEKLTKSIKKIVSDTPNEIDEYIIKKRETIKKIIKRVESIPITSENETFINNELKNLKEDYDREMDSHERWFKVTDYIDKNDYFNECFESLSDYELLEFIAQYIKAPFPPQITQDEFEKLVIIGIQKDEREWLWRLAFNYEGKNMNFDSIVDYFIKVNDGYYLAELISAVGENLDIDSIIDKIQNKELIEDLINRKDSFEISEEQLNKLMAKLN